MSGGMLFPGKSFISLPSSSNLNCTFELKVLQMRQGRIAMRPYKKLMRYKVYLD